jgi:hypothetical protein
LVVSFWKIPDVYSVIFSPLLEASRIFLVVERRTYYAMMSFFVPIGVDYSKEIAAKTVRLLAYTRRTELHSLA